MRASILTLVAALLLSCSREEPRSTLPDWPTEVLAEHAAVDRLLEKGDAKGARACLQEMSLRLEHRKPADEGLIAARKDTYYRLARLDLDAQDLPQALRHCDAGLQLGAAADVFTANLYVLRGTIRQELGQKLDAAEDFHRALLINEKLLNQALQP
jgi:hypothetical protein